MSEERQRPKNKTALAREDSRQNRLKQALRENLKRRKSQAKGRSGTMIVTPEDDAKIQDAKIQDAMSQIQDDDTLKRQT